MSDLHQGQTGQPSCQIRSGYRNVGDIRRLSSRSSEAEEVRSATERGKEKGTLINTTREGRNERSRLFRSSAFPHLFSPLRFSFLAGKTVLTPFLCRPCESLMESPPFRKHRWPRIALWTLVVFVLLGIFGWLGIMVAIDHIHFFEIQFVSAKYDGGVEFLGTRNDEHSPTTFFSVRVKNANEQPMTPKCAVVLHWQEQAIPIHKMASADLQTLGIVVEQPDYKGPEWKHGFIGGGDQNRDWGMEVKMRDDRLVEFYARHNSSAPCPFQLSNGERPPVAFPLSENELKRTFGQPKAIAWFWGH